VKREESTISTIEKKSENEERDLNRRIGTGDCKPEVQSGEKYGQGEGNMTRPTSIRSPKLFSERGKSGSRRSLPIGRSRRERGTQGKKSSAKGRKKQSKKKRGT